MTKYRWIAARKAEGFPVRLCCRALEMAPSSYYDWLDVHGAGATDAELDEAYLVNAIRGRSRPPRTAIPRPWGRR